MKRFIFFVLFLFLTVSPAFAQQPTIKVMTYNIHHGDQLDVNGHRAKVARIVAYIKQNNIEVAGLQEVGSQKDPTVSTMIREELQNVNYPMYIIEPPTVRKGFKNIILSKYPMSNPQWIGQNPCGGNGDCNRWIVIGIVDSPIGKVQIINTHVHHGDDNCESIGQFISKVQPLLSHSDTILMGDFNSGLFNKNCNTKLGDAFKQECTSTSQCDQGPIDWIFLTKNSNELNQISRIVDKSMDASDHFPVISILGSTKQLPTAIPTAIPTRTPPPTVILSPSTSLRISPPPGSGISPIAQVEPRPTMIALAPTSSVPLLQRKVSFSFLDWILSHGPIYLNNLQQLDRIIQTKVSTLFP